MGTLLMVPQFTLPESVLVAQLTDLDFLLVSPRNSVLELRSSCPMLSRPSLENLLENTIHSQECKSLFANNWLMITSCLCLETETCPLLVWREIGPRVVVSSTMTTR